MMLKAWTLALMLCAMVRAEAPNSRPSIVYRDGQSKVVTLACNGYMVGDEKQRVFSIVSTDRAPGRDITHSMDARTLEKYLICERDFDVDDVVIFRNELCKDENKGAPVQVDATTDFVWQKVMKEAIVFAERRAKDPNDREKDREDVRKILSGADPKTDQARSGTYRGNTKTERDREIPRAHQNLK